ncbi:MAG: hypothetical protein ACAH83_06140 [Alphaproteobacteria bacterium]
MEGEGIQKGGTDTLRKDGDTIILSEPKKETPKTIEEAIRAGDWIAVARIRLANIAALERGSHEDVDGDGRVGERKVEARDDAGLRVDSSNGYLDAEGRDPWGYKYNDNFGYDASGNYHDSYGGTLDTKTHVYTAEGGGTSDLKHGVSEKDGTILNHFTNEGMWLNKNDGKYYRVTVDPETQEITFPELGSDKKPIAHTAAEAQQFKADALKNNPEATPEQLAKWETATVNFDVTRYNQAHPPESTSRTPPAPGAAPPPPPPPPGPAPTTIGEALGHNVGLQRVRQVDDLNKGAAAKFALLGQQRTVDTERQQAERKAAVAPTWIGPGASKQEPSRWQAVVSPSVDIAAGNFIGGAKPVGSSLEVKNNPYRAITTPQGDNNPLVMRRSKYRDSNGSLDEDGGYTDKNGGYCYKHGGYMSADGSYIDRMGGNFVDKDGNLWLANNTSGKPDFPKKDGVDYVALLRSMDETSFNARPNNEKTPYDEWVSSNRDAMGDQLQDLQKGLKSVADDWEKKSNATAKADSTTVYKGEGNYSANYVDKDGNLWIDGSPTAIKKRDGVDYTELLKKAAQGKIDEWTATGDLTAAEIKIVKDSVLAAAQIQEMLKKHQDQLNNLGPIVTPEPSGLAKLQEELKKPVTLTEAQQKALGDLPESPSAPSKFTPNGAKAMGQLGQFVATPKTDAAAEEAGTDVHKDAKPVSLKRPPKGASATASTSP